MDHNKGCWLIDSSVLLRIISNDSPAAREWYQNCKLRGDTFFASKFLDLEVTRAMFNKILTKTAGYHSHLVDEYLKDIDLIDVSDEIINYAKYLVVPLRAADAIHLQTAIYLENMSDAEGTITVVTHDAQLAEGAKLLGVPVFDPVTDDPKRPPLG